MVVARVWRGAGNGELVFDELQLCKMKTFERSEHSNVYIFHTTELHT